ncbi:MAG: hypothetical protein JNL21_37115 [Myxococcales bacterium]|nr:hypothetical protein [Myxococcales bacterium]
MARAGSIAWVSCFVLAACVVDATGEGTDRPRCKEDAECPAPADPCTSAVCRANFCYEEPGQDGPLADQTAGDCALLVCEGGSLRTVADGADAADADPCTMDSCTEAGPSHQPAPEGTSCANAAGQNGSCIAGACVPECLVPADCEHTPCEEAICEANRCKQKPVTGEPTLPVDDAPGDCQRPICAAGTLTTEADDADIPEDDNVCTEDTCAAGVPSNDPLPAGPAAGCSGECDGAGVCLACVVDSHCVAGSHCENNVCFACDNGTMDPGETGVDCGDPVCGACLGTTCLTGMSCASGFCVDLVCCDVAVCGECQTCSPSGSCAGVADGLPDDSCTPLETCQDMGCTP